MAKKVSILTPKINYPNKPLIKFVKKANAWCKTTFINDKQVQEWSIDKPHDETQAIS